MERNGATVGGIEHDGLVVITAITGDKDDLRPVQRHQGVKHLAFAEQQADGWESYVPCDMYPDPIKNAKAHKVLGFRYVDAPVIMWIDGNIIPLVDPQKLVDLWLGDKDMAIFKHFARDCVYDEAVACLSLVKGTQDKILKQVRAYSLAGYPEHNGLFECNFFIYRNTPKMQRALMQWWVEICKYSIRDQISFPYIMQINDVKMSIIKGNIRSHPYFNYRPHNYV
jgi:hypothetical protein